MAFGDGEHDLAVGVAQGIGDILVDADSCVVEIVEPAETAPHLFGRPSTCFWDGGDAFALFTELSRCRAVRTDDALYLRRHGGCGTAILGTVCRRAGLGSGRGPLGLVIGRCSAETRVLDEVGLIRRIRVEQVVALDELRADATGEDDLLSFGAGQPVSAGGVDDIHAPAAESLRHLEVFGGVDESATVEVRLETISERQACLGVWFPRSDIRWTMITTEDQGLVRTPPPNRSRLGAFRGGVIGFAYRCLGRDIYCGPGVVGNGRRVVLRRGTARPGR
ncbi:hypothetical protein [Nocardia cyriacigeorgica]|uniref:hypothetical protein n=1 Tax=Nocardia cyriacigeorgica TaxID=135487 RepID=UPI001486335D|nr:hypothetical protein [Nocardia cyriacigeorgica]